MPKTYEKRIKSTATSGDKGHNPLRTEYYDAAGNLVHIEETYGHTVWSQTISGSGFGQNWPNYTNTIVYNTWVMATVS